MQGNWPTTCRFQWPIKIEENTTHAWVDKSSLSNGNNRLGEKNCRLEAQVEEEELH